MQTYWRVIRVDEEVRGGGADAGSDGRNLEGVQYPVAALVLIVQNVRLAHLWKATDIRIDEPFYLSVFVFQLIYVSIVPANGSFWDFLKRLPPRSIQELQCTVNFFTQFYVSLPTSQETIVHVNICSLVFFDFWETCIKAHLQVASCREMLSLLPSTAHNLSCETGLKVK